MATCTAVGEASYA